MGFGSFVKKAAGIAINPIGTLLGGGGQDPQAPPGIDPGVAQQKNRMFDLYNQFKEKRPSPVSYTHLTLPTM
jgi:hypothetical protein